MTNLALDSQSSTVREMGWPAYCCPTHGEYLATTGDGLFCSRGERFSLRQGIPRFVPEKSYADAFGAQWKRYRLTQLDSFSGVPITEERLRRCLGDRLWAGLSGKHVLECGCGAGRFTEILLRQGARVTSIDLSEAVEANQQNCPQTSSHRIAQADISHLPLKLGQFDLVFCLGVIQHTPDPELTMSALAEQVKPGGSLVIDHYTYSLSEFTKAAWFLRQFLKRLSPAMGLRCTERMVDALLPLHRSVRQSRVGRMILGRMSPVVCYYNAYPQLSEEMQHEWALLDTHDFLTSWYRHYRTRKQIERAMKSLGLEEVICCYGGNGIEARGQRPLQLRVG
jgi:2-polyprenyl-3-methyl-5-hydroxy-6-metoxy-1,4-benzoquinol methylase